MGDASQRQIDGKKFRSKCEHTAPEDGP